MSASTEPDWEFEWHEWSDLSLQLAEDAWSAGFQHDLDYNQEPSASVQRALDSRG